jgi:energy-coupling factor transporter transmembrane protein EcfT
MELSTLVGILVVVIIAVFLLKLLGKAVSFVISVASIIVIVWLVVAGLRYMDERDVREKFIDSNNLFVLQDGGSILTGFATAEGDVPELAGVEEAEDPNSELFDRYYKVIVVNKDALPEKTALVLDAADEADKQKLFQSYVENNLLEGDVAENLVNAEKEGDIGVYEETLAFRHGIKEVLVQ